MNKLFLVLRKKLRFKFLVILTFIKLIILEEVRERVFSVSFRFLY